MERVALNKGRTKVVNRRETMGMERTHAVDSSYVVRRFIYTLIDDALWISVDVHLNHSKSCTMSWLFFVTLWRSHKFLFYIIWETIKMIWDTETLR